MPCVCFGPDSRAEGAASRGTPAGYRRQPEQRGLKRTGFYRGAFSAAREGYGKTNQADENVNENLWLTSVQRLHYIRADVSLRAGQHLPEVAVADITSGDRTPAVIEQPSDSGFIDACKRGGRCVRTSQSMIGDDAGIFCEGISGQMSALAREYPCLARFTGIADARRGVPAKDSGSSAWTGSGRTPDQHHPWPQQREGSRA